MDNPDNKIEFTPEYLTIYVAGNIETGLVDISKAKGFSVHGGKGEIIVATDKESIVNVYAADGSKVHSVNVAAGDKKSIAIKAGLYIVNGRKVVVK